MAHTTTQDALCVDDGSEMGRPTNRAEKARAEEMLVFPVTNRHDRCSGQYRVKTHGGLYTVNLSGKWCSCPDSQHRDEICKHRRRVAMMLNDADSALPAPGKELTEAYIEELEATATTLEKTVRLLRGRADQDDLSNDGRVSLTVRASELEDLAGVAKRALTLQQTA